MTVVLELLAVVVMTQLGVLSPIFACTLLTAVEDDMVRSVLLERTISKQKNSFDKGRTDRENVQSISGMAG